MKDIIFDCSSCGQLLEAPADMVGMFVECPKCGEVIKVEPGTGRSARNGKPTATPPPELEKPVESEQMKGSTIRIDLPPNLGIPETPVRKLTIRRKP